MSSADKETASSSTLPPHAYKQPNPGLVAKTKEAAQPPPIAGMAYSGDSAVFAETVQPESQEK